MKRLFLAMAVLAVALSATGAQAAEHVTQGSIAVPADVLVGAPGGGLQSTDAAERYAACEFAHTSRQGTTGWVIGVTGGNRYQLTGFEVGVRFYATLPCTSGEKAMPSDGSTIPAAATIAIVTSRSVVSVGAPGFPVWCGLPWWDPVKWALCWVSPLVPHPYVRPGAPTTTFTFMESTSAS
jgi:hypothetical protein